MSTGAYLLGSSVLRRRTGDKFDEPDQAYRDMAAASRDCRTYSRKAAELVDTCLEACADGDEEAMAEEAVCLLAAVDAAAGAARHLLTLMGRGADVANWEAR